MPDQEAKLCYNLSRSWHRHYSARTPSARGSGPSQCRACGRGEPRVAHTAFPSERTVIARRRHAHSFHASAAEQVVVLRLFVRSWRLLPHR